MRRILIALLTAAVAFPARASAGETWSQTFTPANITGGGIRTIAVVPINFEGQRTRPTTQARLDNMFFNSPDTDKFSESLASYWELSSYGQERIEGKVFELTPLDGKSSCDKDLGEDWANQAESYWASRGEYLDDYDHVFLIMPRRNCDFGGYADIPGKLIVINQYPSDWASVRARSSVALSTIAHELLHNLGFDHSGIVGCLAEGKKVSLGGVCKETDRYKYDWDPYEIITSSGYWPKHLLNSFQRITLGFMPESEQVRLDTAGTYNLSLNPIEFSASATKALIIRRTGLNEYVTPTYDSDDMPTSGAPDICIEWHQPKGWFNNFNSKSSVVRGISMRLCDLYSGGVEYLLEDGGSETGFFQAGTRLIDATPGSKVGKADWTDAQLTKGTWTDEFTGITIRVVGFDKTGTDRSQWSVQLEVVIP
jgi:hypothetical protein